MKHGNSLFYNTEKIIINDYETFVIPVEYNSKNVDHVDILLLNEEIYTKTYKLFQYTQEFLKTICEINRDFICSGGVYHPVGLVIEPKNKEDDEKLTTITKKYFKKNSTKYNVETVLNLIAKNRKIADAIYFYKNIPL